MKSFNEYFKNDSGVKFSKETELFEKDTPEERAVAEIRDEFFKIEDELRNTFKKIADAPRIGSDSLHTRFRTYISGVYLKKVADEVFSPKGSHPDPKRYSFYVRQYEDEMKELQNIKIYIEYLEEQIKTAKDVCNRYKIKL